MRRSTPAPVRLATPLRSHLTVLDGLRGVAAVCVLAGHSTLLTGNDIVPRVLLAVHFFFMLSGFVMAYTYQERLASGYPLRRFFLARAIRLYPMIFAGSLLMVLTMGRHPSTLLLRQVALGAFAVPSLSDGNFLNAPEWSIFFELVSYVGFGLLFYRLRSRALGLLLLPLLLTGLYGMARYTNHVPVLFHWADAPASFILGMLLYRMWRAETMRRWQVPASLLATVLLFVCLAPRSLGPVVDWLAVLVLFPLLIVGGAYSTARYDRLNTVLGNLSYPLYMVHWPILLFIGAHARRWNLSGVAATILFFAVSLAVSYLCLRFYDQPLRRRLIQVTMAR